MKPACLFIATAILLSVTSTTVCKDVCSDFGIGGILEKAYSRSDNCSDVCVETLGIPCIGSLLALNIPCTGRGGVEKAIKYCCCSDA